MHTIFEKFCFYYVEDLIIHKVGGNKKGYLTKFVK